MREPGFSGLEARAVTIVDHDNSVPRHVAMTALAALEVGDHPLAVDLLLNALQQDGAYTVRARCDSCGAVAEWPGLLWQNCRCGRPVREAEAELRHAA